MILGGQTLIMILFALSLDLILGYAGIVTLGPRRVFSARRLCGGVCGHVSAGASRSPDSCAAARRGSDRGFLSGWLLLRYRGLALLVLTLSTTIMLQQLGNLFRDFTGGYDGIPGVTSRRCSAYSITISTAIPIISIVSRCCHGLLLRPCGGSPIRRSGSRSSVSAKTSPACTRSVRRFTAARRRLRDLRRARRHRRRAVRQTKSLVTLGVFDFDQSPRC